MVLWLKYGKLLMTEGKFDEGLDCFKKIVRTAPADMLLSLEEVINQLTVQVSQRKVKDKLFLSKNKIRKARLF